MVNIEQDSKNEGQIAIESMAAVVQVLQEMKAEYKVSRDFKTIGTSVNQFVLYKWGDFDEQLTQVYFPNTENYKIIRFYFVYGVNFVLLVVLVAWIADSTFLAEQSLPSKICLAFILLLLEFWLLEICG